MSDKLLTGFIVVVAVAGIVSIVSIISSYYSNQNKLIAEAKTCEAAVMLKDFDVSTRMIICRLGGKADDALTIGNRP
jgi:hypothetical protein